MKQLLSTWVYFIKRLFSPGHSTVQPNEEQAVIIHLDGSSLSEEIYEACDISTLSELLEAALEGTNAGELDGDEFSAEGVTLYLYGADAEKLFEAIKPVLLTYPLCQAGSVTIRKGSPSVQGTTLSLPLNENVLV